MRLFLKKRVMAWPGLAWPCATWLTTHLIVNVGPGIDPLSTCTVLRIRPNMAHLPSCPVPRAVPCCHRSTVLSHLIFWAEGL